MKGKINLSQVGAVLSTLGEMLAIAADALHRADRVLEKKRMGAIGSAKEGRE